MRIGYLNTRDDHNIPAIEQSVCNYLASQPPLVEEVALTDLAIIAYEDSTLPSETTVAWKILASSLTATFLRDQF